RAPGGSLRAVWAIHRRAHGAQAHRLGGALPAGRRGVPRRDEPARELRRAGARAGRLVRPAGPHASHPALPALGGERRLPRTTGMTKKHIEECIRDSLESYFKDLRGVEPTSMYDMIMNVVEKPLLDVVMKHAEGNQSRAAEWLGINRNTLRR